ILHAAVEGLSRPNEGERTVARASLDTLPDVCRLVVAGHIHRFARQRMGEREVVVVGATERMEFGAQAGEPGFVWAELTRAGVGLVEHIRTQAQPRAEIALSASQLWPEAAPAADVDAANPALEVIRAALVAACEPETMARLRLTGALSRERYHQLALHDVIALGQQIAFSLDVDTTGLTLEEQSFALPTPEARAEAYSPTQVLAQVVEETLRESQSGAPGLLDPADVRAAGELLLARLRGSGEEGA
ncbi:MAG: hypothetical protein ACRDID_10235, partial [Ktedonobacterales bacterium]